MAIVMLVNGKFLQQGSFAPGLLQPSGPQPADCKVDDKFLHWWGSIVISVRDLQSATSSPQSSVCNLQSATSSPQLAVCNLQYAVRNSQSSVRNQQSATRSPQSATCSLQPAVRNQQSATCSRGLCQPNREKNTIVLMMQLESHRFAFAPFLDPRSLLANIDVAFCLPQEIAMLDPCKHGLFCKLWKLWC
ncbi:hypothetical protein DUNSADRAFT_10778 [Dunaliella salina]|uniref:Encoded protein n=1 Tax=Dunaliella salina TaxID=3046 RepID=A0ABQ7GEJ5_DUNSA|nr:hypothetical protein DUNSADRAFT_10778 [Dunaliella salina]|eukprot:KAF5833032.1 hypothetical protein DUNSADRAFT_10778 [Dunaliella salina]